MMDDEIKSSAELEKALEEQVTGEIPDLTEATANIKAAGTALGELVDIRDTVLIEGVSQEDVRSVFDIIKRLNDQGIECGVAPALEEYELGHYTQSRTIVNQQISLEGMGATIVKVIKTVIEKLIEYVVGLVRKYKVWQANDKKIERNFEMARNKAKDIQDGIAKLRRYALTSTTEVDNQTLEYTKHLLGGAGKLPRTKVGLAALFDTAQIETIQLIHKETEQATRYLRASTKSMKVMLNGDGSSGSVDTTAIQQLSVLYYKVELLLMEDPEPNFLLHYIDPKVLLNNTIHKLAVPIGQYEYLIKAFYAIADDLRGIKKVNLGDSFDENTARGISDSIVEMTQAFEDLDVIIQFMIHVKNTQLQVFKVQLQILNRYTSLLLLSIRDNTVHETSRKAAEDTFSKLEKKLRSYGM